MLRKLLCEAGFPAIDIHRGMNQLERLKRYKQFKDPRESMDFRNAIEDAQLDL